MQGLLDEIQHELEDLEPTTFSSANFTAILSPTFQSLKARFIVVTDILGRYHPDSTVTLIQLDRAILLGGKPYYDAVADLLRASSSRPPSKSLMGWIKTSFRHLFRAGHENVQRLVNAAARQNDVDFLNNNLFMNSWDSRMPRSFSQLQRLATSWLRDEIESQTLTIAQTISDTQTNSAQQVSRMTIDVYFEIQKRERLEIYKQEINQGEADRRERWAQLYDTLLDDQL